MDAQIDANESTFQAVSGRWIEVNKHWSRGYADQVARDLANDLYPKIGRLPVGEIKAAHRGPIIQLVAKRGAECTANNLRMWCSQILSFAAAHGIEENDPTVFLKGLVRRAPVRHNPPLSQSQLPDFLHKLDQGVGTPSTDLALKLMLLTLSAPSNCARRTGTSLIWTKRRGPSRPRARGCAGHTWFRYRSRPWRR